MLPSCGKKDKTDPLHFSIGARSTVVVQKMQQTVVVLRFLLHGFGFIAGFWENPEILSRVYV
jgi:hypothetical protein